MSHERTTEKSGMPKLGVPLHLIQLYLGVLVALAYLFATYQYSPDFDYDVTMVRSLLLTGASCVSIWMIAKHMSAARKFTPVAMLLTMALSVYDVFFQNGAETMMNVIGEPAVYTMLTLQYSLDLAVMAYMFLSKHARETLSRPFSIEPGPGGFSASIPLRKRLRTWEFYRDLALYMVVFSFLGHWAEMLFCQLIRLGIVMGDYDPSNSMLWNEWLYPFSAEGIAVVMIVVLLYPFQQWILKRTGGRVVPSLILSFLLNMLVCTSIDFSTGITANYDYHLWDYRNMPFNFMGQVCLQNSLVYTTAATLIVWVFYPLMDHGLRKLPKDVVNTGFWFLAGMYGFLALLHFMYLTPAGLMVN